jgi:hypothetical protein
MRLPIRTARENPMGFSKGEPEEMFWRMMVFLMFRFKFIARLIT